MSKENILKFFKDRPCISINCIEAEAGLSRSTIGFFLRGERMLTDDHIKKLIPILKKYGYKNSK